ncbi:MAG: hypothetical protein ACJ79U_23020 [Myxococcales bacterium]
MITPRLFRRSLGHAFQARLLLLSVLGSLFPAALAALPVLRFLSPLLDHSPRAKDLAASLDSHTVMDLLRGLNEPGAAGAVATGFGVAAVVAFLVGPFLAGAALIVARAEGTVRTRALLASAGENYGRLFRVALVGLVPIGAAFAVSGALFNASRTAAERAITESQAARGGLLATLGAVVLFFVAQLCVDAARGMLAAEAYRQSALAASWAGLRLVVRRPLRALGLGLATLLAGGGAAFVLLLLRLRIPQAGAGSVLAAFVLAQLGAAGIAWHRAARIVGFADLARADAADRERRSAFAMRPPEPLPPAAPATETRSAILDALAPPASVPPAARAVPAERPLPSTDPVSADDALSDPRRSGT